MKITRNAVPERIRVPGAVARQALDFGVTSRDGSCETISGGDLFIWPAGHTVAVSRDAEIMLFSPQAEHRAVVDHVRKQLGL